MIFLKPVRAGLLMKKPVKNLIYRFLEIRSIDFFQTLIKDAPRGEKIFRWGHISWF